MVAAVLGIVLDDEDESRACRAAAGNAFDDTSQARPAVGYGIGARVRTPIGPFRLDLAYGEQSRQVRLHFSVGIAF